MDLRLGDAPGIVGRVGASVIRWAATSTAAQRLPRDHDTRHEYVNVYEYPEPASSMAHEYSLARYSRNGAGAPDRR